MMDEDSSPPPGSPKDKLVLIVDDDEGSLSLLKKTVEFEGFRFETAMSGGEALRAVDKNAPDLIILDLMLPGQGGLEILHELQAAGAGSIPVIIVTARQAERTMVEMLRRESNVIEFMQKPVKPVVLGSFLHRTLKTRPGC